MEFITLNSEVEMPALGLGVFQTPPEETRAAVEAALTSGYRLIDTAAACSNEQPPPIFIPAGRPDRHMRLNPRSDTRHVANSAAKSPDSGG
jgi:diketogulonate reductase-like aldo/keto reductase